MASKPICFDIRSLIQKRCVLLDHTGNICDPAQRLFRIRICELPLPVPDSSALSNATQRAVIPLDWQEPVLLWMYRIASLPKHDPKFLKIGMLCTVHG